MDTCCYVVLKGRSPGIYLSWTECKEQIHKFPSSKFQKCKTIAEAESIYSAFFGTTHCKEVLPLNSHKHYHCILYSNKSEQTVGFYQEWNTTTSTKIQETPFFHKLSTKEWIGRFDPEERMISSSLGSQKYGKVMLECMAFFFYLNVHYGVSCELQAASSLKIKGVSLPEAFHFHLYSYSNSFLIQLRKKTTLQYFDHEEERLDKKEQSFLTLLARILDTLKRCCTGGMEEYSFHSVFEMQRSSFMDFGRQ